MPHVKNSKKIRVLIAEDSPLIQKLLIKILSEDSVFEVVGVASSGVEAVKLSRLFKPDIISMDLMMPLMDGLEATKRIMQTNPVPVVIVSSIYKPEEIHLAVKELDSGAVAILPKPEGPGSERFIKDASKYRNMLKIMSEIRVVRRPNNIPASQEQKFKKNIIKCSPPEQTEIIAIGASAGGPESLREILTNLTYPLNAPIIIVQHIDVHFVEGFSLWLQQYAKCRVKLADEGEQLLKNTIYIAPGKRHITIKKPLTVYLSTPKEGENGHIPSIDFLMESIANCYGNRAVAILLSGMGRDGAQGIYQAMLSGSYTIAQNQESCLIYGMPAEAVKIGAVCKVMPPFEIAQEINRLLMSKPDNTRNNNGK